MAQARSWLPDPIGGVLWFSVDDTYSAVYFPVYCGVTEVPYNYAVGTGSFHEFTWDSAFWVFNWVSNFAYLRYSEMIQDIQVVQRELEGKFLADQPQIDAAALALHEQAPRLAKDYLTSYTKETGAAVVARWRKLGEFLLYRYLDGNLKTELGAVTHPGYPESWYEKVAAATGDHLEMKQLAPEKAAEEAAEAEKQAQVAGLSAAILTLLESRGVAIGDEAQDKIGASEDPAELGHWLVNAATAGSEEELFAEKAAVQAH